MVEDYFGIVGTTQAGLFNVEAVVAEGGFSVVYRAFHLAFRAPVALKCLKMPGHLSDGQRQVFVERFCEEAALLFQLSASSAAIVRPLQVDTLVAPDARLVPFIALEWLEGFALDKLIAERRARGLPPLGLTAVVLALGPVARALALAHCYPTAAGPVAIVHHDIKPEHFFLAAKHGERAIKLFDFGIATARSLVNGSALAADAGPVAFTLHYGAPEQWYPSRYGPTGPWTDVWALALSIIEIASGNPVFAGTSEQICAAACDESRRPALSDVGLAAPDAVERVFGKALSVDPRARFENAGAFWNALDEAVESCTTADTLGGVAPGDAARIAPSGTSLELVGFPSERLVFPERSGASDDERASMHAAAAPSEKASRFAHVRFPEDAQADATGTAAREAGRSGRAGKAVARPRGRFTRVVTLIGLGVALLVLDQVYANATGSLLALGPMRMTWLAGLLTFVGVALGLRAFLALYTNP